MDQILIRGGNPLNGTIEISGAKNAALPLMTTCLLTDETVSLSNIPHLHDIASLASVLSEMGVSIGLNGQANGGADGRVMTLNAGALKSTTAPYELVRKMRASVLVLGPLVARHGSACVSLPGGCAIGTRPVDLHISGLEKLGAEIELKDGYIYAKAPNGLTGAHITFPKVSVGATENIMMAACLAKGESTLSNAAREPEIIDLGDCLIAMGAKIEGLGTDTIKITGVDTLHGCDHSVLADRIETGTYILAAAMTGGNVTLTNTKLDFLEALLPPLQQSGIDVSSNDKTGHITVKCKNDGLNSVDIMTEPYPGFPTDIQAQIMAMLTIANGAGMVTETIFENRFMHVPELIRMGANITIHGSSALVRGVDKLRGAEVMATDLRASVSLVMAGLVAEGETVVNRIYHLDRGYEKLVEKLSAVGADLERITA